MLFHTHTITQVITKQNLAHFIVVKTVTDNNLQQIYQQKVLFSCKNSVPY